MSQSRTGDVLISAQSVSKHFGAQPVFNDLSLSIHEKERVGLVGRNGAGKSTLLRILAGEETADSGVVTRKRGVRVGYLNQQLPMDPSRSVGSMLDEASAEIIDLLAEHDRLTEGMEQSGGSREAADRHAALHHTLELAEAWRMPEKRKRLGVSLRLPDEERLVGTLSGGELRRVSLAAVILPSPDILLLDEPTNHIDAESAEWVERFLAGYPGSCVLVTHDRYFLDLVVNRIVEIEAQRLYSFPGKYARFLEYKLQVKAVAARSSENHKRLLKTELAWLRRGAKARSTKQKARIHRFDKLEENAPPPPEAELGFLIPKPPRLGKRIVDAEKVGLRYGDNVLFHDFDFILQKGMRVGIVGPNGCGKTSLLRALMGLEENIEGRVKIGETTEFLYVDQRQEEIDPEKSILDFVSNGAMHWEVNGNRVFVPAYLEGFLFDRKSVRMPMRNLSGGERNRVQIAKKLLQGGNVLVLDEPTNDLDLSTLRVLEEAVVAFDGCALVVSHDRYFLNRVCTHILGFEGGGKTFFTAGNYDDYQTFRARQADDTEPKPTPQKQATPRPSTRAPRLTYKEKAELEGMDAAIEAADAEVARLETVIGEAEFFEGDHETVRSTVEALEKARKNVSILYTRWETLEARAVQA